MRWHHYLLTLALLTGLAAPAPATGLFGRRPKAAITPAERVQELLTTLRSNPDDRKRVDAAEDLRQFDAGTHPDLVPVLTEVLRSDHSAAVRAEVAHTLGRLRPVSQAAGQALEAAANQDASVRVRWQARTSLVGYHLGGYHAGKAKEPDKVPPQGPPLNPPRTVTMTPPLPSAPQQVPAVAPPPVAPPAAAAVPPSEVPMIARPLPRGPAQAQPVPVVNSGPMPARKTAPTSVPVTTFSSPPAPIPVTTVPPRTAAPPVPVAAPYEGPVLAPQQ